MHFKVFVFAVWLVSGCSSFSVIRDNERAPAIIKCDGSSFDEPGEYVITGDIEAPSESCYVLFLAQPDENIEITVKMANFNCTLDPSYAILFDGAHEGLHFFPPMSDEAHERQQQFKTVCASGAGFATFRTSTNALTIVISLNNISGPAMQFLISFVRNPNPCNMVVEGAGTHILQNVGGRRENCSMLIMQPAEIELDYVRVGHQAALHSSLRTISFLPDEEAQTKLMNLGAKCAEKSTDLLEIATFPISGGDTVNLCGDLDYDDDDVHRYAIESCGPVVINLSSSGNYHNNAVVTLRGLTAGRTLSADGQCLWLTRPMLVNTLEQN